MLCTLPKQAYPPYYTQPQKVPLSEPSSLKDFWLSEKRLPQTIEAISTTNIPAIVVKKGDDFPPFWQKDASFLEVMEELYKRIEGNLKRC